MFVRITQLVTAMLLLCHWMANGQTNVKGGIYSDLTWTKANSPYIVTDTIVVFPGVTLTIDPGVEVQFANNKRLEIRQGSLMAVGTDSNMITFTSNATIRNPGAWNSIYLNGGTMASTFSHCNFRYAKEAIGFYADGQLKILHSVFDSNYNGIKANNQTKGNATIDSTIFRNNANFGADFTYYGSYSGTGKGVLNVNHSQFINNYIGLGGQYNKYGFVKNSVFQRNTSGLYAHFCIVDSCTFFKNKIGIESYNINLIRNCFIDSNTAKGIASNSDTISNCLIRRNTIGVHLASSILKKCTLDSNQSNIKDYCCWGPSSVISNTITNGLVGIDSVVENFYINRNIIENNDIGIFLKSSSSQISCNKICALTYTIKYGTSSNTSLLNNYWCTTDSATIKSSIYDGYNNINMGLVSFLPFDTACYLTSPPASTGLTPVTAGSFRAFPNPARDYLQLDLAPGAAQGTAVIVDLTGRQLAAVDISENRTRINIAKLPAGIYILQVSTGNATYRQRFVKE